jgi:hypothetical protein
MDLIGADVLPKTVDARRAAGHFFGGQNVRPFDCPPTLNEIEALKKL